jgi:predicted acetylornithine/succinylornithine family transaminase
MKTQEIIAGEGKYLLPTYERPPVVFSHGSGAYLFDSEGRRYLDFTAGIAVTALGHADPEWVAAVCEQAGRLVHVSNLFHTAPHVELARRLVEHSFADRVFFCNSGSEANEGALKLARIFARSASASGPEAGFNKTGIVAFSGGFHGRTMGALSTTYKRQYREPFEPLVPGVAFAPFNDLKAAALAIGDDTCAVIVEPIQGEGGIHPADPDFLRGLRDLCDGHGALLIFDEVQCGLGRSGTLWAHEAYGVYPDMMTLAKPLAGGLPIGAILTTEAVAEVIGVGDHGSTFAAGPLVCRAAEVTFDRVSQPEFLAAVRAKSVHLLQLLHSLEAEQIVAIRGKGLLIGVELDRPVKPLIDAAREKGLLVIGAGVNVLRLAPPLIITKDEIDSAVGVLVECLAG